MKKVRFFGLIALAAVWLGLTVSAWTLPSKEISEAERRELEQFPELSGDTLLSGEFMEDFEGYTQDQFPLRDTFRQIKAWFHYNILRQGDNNSIYVADGYAAKMEYPLREDSLEYALQVFEKLYETYLADTGSAIYASVVPDKSYYLAEENGYLAMDYEKLFQTMEQGMSYAQYVDITDGLNGSSYYRTDTHWRQEYLLPVAEKLAEAMGIEKPKAEDYTQVTLERPFYGVYYGQAALPMEPEELNILTSALLEQCRVYNHETGTYGAIYDMEKLNSNDLYEVFLSGSVSLLTIENPLATTDKELIVFRDSFGSAIVPLLAQGYRTITVVDIRYLPSARLGSFLDFHGQDVLFLYSALVLNNSEPLK